MHAPMNLQSLRTQLGGIAEFKDCGDYYHDNCGCGRAKLEELADVVEVIPTSRLAFFSPHELLVLQGGLSSVITDILTAAGHDAIEADHRVDAANTLLQAAAMSLEIDEVTGTDHPPLEEFQATAQAIADGTFAEALRLGIAEKAQGEALAAAASKAQPLAEPNVFEQKVWTPSEAAPDLIANLRKSLEDAPSAIVLPFTPTAALRDVVA